MKTLVTLFFVIGSTALADHYKNAEITDCRVTRMIDYTYFEEGLSANEYPDVDVRVSRNGQYSVGIGSHQAYEVESGDQISIKSEKYVKSSVQVLKKEGDQVLLEIEWRKTMAKLVIKVKEQGTRKFKTIAYGICNKGMI